MASSRFGSDNRYIRRIVNKLRFFLQLSANTAGYTYACYVNLKFQVRVTKFATLFYGTKHREYLNFGNSPKTGFL